MDSPPLDQSRDPFLAFASEESVTPTTDREPAFLRIPTAYDGHLSITSTVADHPPSQPVSARPMTMVAVVIGVVAGFAGGYVFADRIIGPSVTPAHRIAAPTSASAPAAARTAAAAPAAAPVASVESAKPTPEPSTESARGPSVVKATEVAAATVTPAASAPRSTRRAPIPSSKTRPSTIPQSQPTAAPNTALGGSIEIMSRPRDAQVLLDGTVVGRAPMSIANVSEGMHEVRVELDGFKPWVGSVRVKGGSRARVGASLEQ
jgi:PEGA domain